MNVKIMKNVKYLAYTSWQFWLDPSWESLAGKGLAGEENIVCNFYGYV